MFDPDKEMSNFPVDMMLNTMKHSGPIHDLKLAVSAPVKHIRKKRKTADADDHDDDEIALVLSLTAENENPLVADALQRHDAFIRNPN